MGDLRERLIAANLASGVFRASDGYLSVGINTNEDAAEASLVVVAAWLRDEATGIKERANSAESLTGRTVLIVQAEVLERLADSITGDTDG